MALFYRTIVWCLAFAVFCMGGGQALSEDIHGLSGRPFTDISRTMPMPDEWKDRPVRYDPAFKGADLVVSLDQQMYPAFKPVIERYAKENGLKVVIRNGTCGISSGMLYRKSVDIGGYCCPPGIADRLPGLRFHTIGISALAIIVNQKNPVDNVKLEEARRIFMGETFRWSELRAAHGKTGLSVPIQPVGRLHCKSRPGHWRLLLDHEDLFSPRIIEVGAIPDMIRKVSDDVRAIGYETMWMTRHFRQGESVRQLKIDGHDPDDTAHLLSGEYPLYRVYNLTTWEGEGLENPLARRLVEFLIEEAEKLDGKFGLVPASGLRQAGWKFSGDELTGAPD